MYAYRCALTSGVHVFVVPQSLLVALFPLRLNIQREGRVESAISRPVRRVACRTARRREVGPIREIAPCWSQHGVDGPSPHSKRWTNTQRFDTNQHQIEHHIQNHNISTYDSDQHKTNGADCGIIAITSCVLLKINRQTVRGLHSCVSLIIMTVRLMI